MRQPPPPYLLQSRYAYDKDSNRELYATLLLPPHGAGGCDGDLARGAGGNGQAALELVVLFHYHRRDHLPAQHIAPQRP